MAASRPSDDAAHRCSIMQAARDIKQLASSGTPFWYTAVLISAQGGERLADIVMDWVRHASGAHLNYDMLIHGEHGDTGAFVLHAWSHYPVSGAVKTNLPK